MHATLAPAIALPPPRPERWLLAGIVVIGLLVSGSIASDRLTWCLEVIWAMVGLALIAWRWPRFPLTRLLCWLLAVLASSALIYHVFEGPVADLRERFTKRVDASPFG